MNDLSIHEKAIMEIVLTSAPLHQDAPHPENDVLPAPDQGEHHGHP